MFFEHAVKIRNGIDVDERTNLLDGVRGGLQKRISVIHFLFVKIIGNGFTDSFLKRTANIKRKIQVMKKTRMQMPINHFASKKLHICYTTHFTNTYMNIL